MSQGQYGLNRLSGVGIVAAFGFLTMSSGFANNSLATMNSIPIPYYESINYGGNDYTTCNSSLLSRRSMGDIFAIEKKTDFVQVHEKIEINLRITKITKHKSNFEFEEEYEEI